MRIPTLHRLVLLPLLLLLSIASAAEQEPEPEPSSSLRRTQQQQDGPVTPAEEEGQIIGGVDASEGEFPFFVKFEGGILCGGSLLSPNRVLTAGHCIKSYGWPSAVRVGATTHHNGEVVNVKCGIVHPGYLSPFLTVLADIAVLKLETNVTSVTSFVQLNRNTSYPAIEGQPLEVTGFGKVANDGGTSNTLKKVGTFFVPRPKCVETYNDMVVRPEAHLCGDVANAGDCNGDSGGPLMDENKVQVGIVSFGYGGCASDYQDVYAKVASYVDWIDQQMTDETCPERPSGSSTGGCVFTGMANYARYGGGVLAERVTNWFGNTFWETSETNTTTSETNTTAP